MTSLPPFPTFPTRSTAADGPRPLGDPAYHGLVGDFARLVEPHTEADINAVIAVFLVAAGNIMGYGPCWTAGPERHSVAEYALLVGSSGSGKKGTAGNIALWPFKLMDDTLERPWLNTRIAAGLSSGEGLVWQVRDPTYIEVGDGEEPQVEDAGVADHRLFVVEAEFAQGLKVLRREGNTLSPIVRGLWDNGQAGALTKTARTTTTKAHVSIVGHITPEELRRHLVDVELLNGFANRFLFVHSKRSKLLPDGGELTDAEMVPIVTALYEAVTAAERVGDVGFTPDAAELWRVAYMTSLNRERAGVLGAINARAAAHVRRLAVIYALLDKRKTVTHDHLVAALEIWRYCEESAELIFGNSLGDKLLTHLSAADADGLSRTQIREIVGGRVTATEIQDALDLLHVHDRANPKTFPTAGRPEERWVVTTVERGDNGANGGKS